MDKKLLEIEKAEALERDKQNQLITVTQHILNLKRGIDDNEIEAGLQQKEFDSLKQECNRLRIDIELQEQLKIGFQSKIEVSERISTEQKMVLQNTQQKVWDTLISFVNENKLKVENESLNNAQEFVKMRSFCQEIQSLKMEVLQLEGKVRALKMYKNFQENRLKAVSKSVQRSCDNDQL